VIALSNIISSKCRKKARETPKIDLA